MHSKFTLNDSVPCVKKCKNKRCGCCESIIECRVTTFEEGTVFQIKTTMDCNSSNLIYRLDCAGCNRTYIGQTGDKLLNRVRVHRQHVNNREYAQLSASTHIPDCIKESKKWTPGMVKFYITPFYKMRQNSTQTEREAKELFFIHKFKPSLNRQS